MKNKKKKQGNIEKGKLYKLVMNLYFFLFFSKFN